MNKVLITGSQGFIGSYLCQELLSNNCEVWGIDNFSKYGKVSRPHDNHPNFHFIEANVQDIDKWNVEFDYIIAIAAMIGGISFFHKFAYDLIPENNSILDATFRWALGQQKQLKRLIMLSSSMVFEGTDSYPTFEEDLKTCRIPDSTYGFQKLMCEFYCKNNHMMGGSEEKCSICGEPKAYAYDVHDRGDYDDIEREREGEDNEDIWW